MTDPDRDAPPVEVLTDGVGTEVPDGERDGGPAVRRVGRADDPHAPHPAQLVQRPCGEPLVVGRQPGATQPVEVGTGRGQADGLGDHRCACLEAVRGFGVLGAGHRHRLVHVPAGEERWQLTEQTGPAPQHADTGRPAHLVPGEREKVHAETADVHRHVRDRLAGIEHGERTDLPGPPDQRRDGVDGAVHVGLVGEGQHPGTAVDRLLQPVQVEPPLSGDAQPPQLGSRMAAQLLPWHQVRVVFHLGDDHAVTRAQRMGAQRAGACEAFIRE